MTKRLLWVVTSGLVVIAILLAACAPAPTTSTAPATPAAPAAPATPATPASPATPAAPTTAVKTDMMTVKLTKKDGTVVEKEVRKPQYGGTVVMSPGTANEGFDESVLPHWTLTSTVGLVNEELVTGDWRASTIGTGEMIGNYGAWFQLNYVVGELAQSWEIEGPTTIVFHLRQGIHWQNKPPVNGRELVADDVVFSIRRIFIDIKTSPHLAGPATPLDVKARDKYTVVVEAPAGQTGYTFEYVSAWTRIYAPEVAKLYKDYQDWRNSVGTGPYIISDFVAQSSLTYTKNPDYWNTDPIYGKDYPLPYINTIKSLRIPDRSTEMAALRTGKIDLSHTNFNTDDWKSLQQTTPRLLALRGLYGSHDDWGMRLDNPTLPWAGTGLHDPKGLAVRRALMMAIDAEEWRDTVYGGDAEVMSWFVPPNWPQTIRVDAEDLPLAPDGFDNRKQYLNKSIGRTQQQNIDEAKKMLADAGYPNGFKAEVIIESNQTMPQDAEIVKAYWAKIGVDLDIKVVTAAIRESMKQKGSHTQMIGHTGSMNIAYCMMHWRAGNTYYNLSIVNDPFYDEAYNYMTANYFNDAIRGAKMREVQIRAHNDVAYIILPVPYTYRPWQPWVLNYNGIGDLNIYDGYDIVQFSWIDQALKASLLK